MKNFIILCLMYFFCNKASCRDVPRYVELDDDEQLLFRAAYDTTHDATYDTPAYDHDQDDHDSTKIDLLKDGLWAIKSEMKALKAFNKAFAANLLSTKLKLKGLKKGFLMPVLDHHHVEPEKKPTYSYQAPSYAAPHQYEYASAPQQPQYQYQAPMQPHYQPAPQQYQPPPQQYQPPPPQYQGQHAHDPYYGI